MLMGLPKRLTRDMLVDMLWQHRFKGRFDFLYLPRSFSSGGSWGYAFVNMTSASSAREVKHKLQDSAGFGGHLACQVMWAETQGLQANIERFRNSPIMRGPRECQPLLFGPDGAPKRFPRPTEPVKKPKPNKEARRVLAGQAFPTIFGRSQ